jgi:hypothetical protein
MMEGAPECPITAGISTLMRVYALSVSTKINKKRLIQLS